MCLAGFVAAIIVPKLPPLSWKKDLYIDDTPRHEDDETIPASHGVFSWGFEQAMQRASTEASKTIVVGFADMFIPSILASSIESDLTRFVIAALSVTQLIYMSEVGALLIGSKIPVNFFELFVIFILRTLVTLPIIALMGHLLI